MAIVCDYCGDAPEDDSKLISVAFKHNQEIALKGATASEWYFYCEGECEEAVRAMLDNLRLFAMHGEGSGLMWALTEQPKAPKPEKLKPAGKPPSAGGPKIVEKEGEVAEPGDRDYYDDLADYLGDGPPSVSDFRERKENGSPIADAITHKASQSALHKADIVTIEDCAKFSEVEFMGIPGVGAKIIERVRAAMLLNNLEFKPGPTKQQLGGVLRELRREFGVNDTLSLTRTIARKLDVPEKMWGRYNKTGTDEKEAHDTRAFKEIEGGIGDAEAARKAPQPGLLAALADYYEFGSVDALLERASEFNDLSS